jgi:hypothetical protein
MKNYFLYLTLCGLALFTQACGQKIPSPEEACHFQQNSYQQRVSWAWKTPIVMYSDQSVNMEQKEALLKAMAIWNQTFLDENFKRGAVFEYGGAVEGDVGFRQDKKNIVSVVPAGSWTGKDTEQAETIIYWKGTDISESDMRINGTKPLSVNDAGERGKYDLVALFVHELGHVLGLLHIETEDYTAMDARLSANNVERRNIGDLEIDALKCEY